MKKFPWDLTGHHFVVGTFWQHPSLKPITEGLTRRGAKVWTKDEILDTLKTSLKPPHLFAAVVLPSAELRADNQWLAGLLNCPLLSELDLAQAIVPAAIVAVTGTNGKTSTSEMIAAALVKAGKRVETFVNFEDSVCNLKVPATEFAVVECWSSQLETCETFAPRVSVFLNLEPNHLDHHPDFEAYAQAKCKIFTRQGKGCTLVFNPESPELMARVAKFAAPELEQIPFLHGEDARQRFAACADLGAHFDANRLAALEVAKALRLSENEQQAYFTGVCTYLPRPHRQQVVNTIGGVQFINDSKSTSPHSAIAALKRFAATKPLVLITGGSDKNLPLEDFCRAAGKHADRVLLAYAFPRLEKALAAAGVPYENAADFAEALRLARGTAQTAGTVLFSPVGASDPAFKDYEDRGVQFMGAVERLSTP